MRIDKLVEELTAILSELGHLNRMSLFYPGPFPKNAGEVKPTKEERRAARLRFLMDNDQ